MKILFLSQRVPYPPNRGDKITTWRLIERMRRDHAVRVMAFAHDEADRRAADELRGMGFDVATFPHHRKWAQLAALPLLLTQRPLTLGVYGSRDLQREVDRCIGDFDLAYAYSSSMGAFMLPHGSLPRIMHMAELDSDKWRQYAESKGFPARWVYAREHRTLLAFERELAAACDLNVFCTPLEEEIGRRELPGAATCVLPNGVDLERFAPAPEQAEPGHLVFCGVMDYFPNVDACVWLAREILPRVHAEFPDARFSIVGSNPAPEVLELGLLSGVSVTGFVEDTRDWLRRASVSVAPMRIARGIQNKVLEGMAMGLPVVGTTPSTRGVGARPGIDYLVADDADGITAAICGLLRDPERARELGSAGRRYVEEHYDWEAVLSRLPGILDRSIESYRSRKR